MQKGALPGFRDFYPEDLALRAHIFEVWRRVATRYGFEEYDGPPLESLELYTAKSGEEIVGQLYNFTDKGDRAVALRPEMTPTLARMVAARANGLKKPIRWFSMPQLFRYERQQRGRLREHFQLNCDLIGEAGPLADAEVIALAIDVMRGFKLTEKDFRVRLSDRRAVDVLLEALGLDDSGRRTAYDILDKSGRFKLEELEVLLAKSGLSDEQSAGIFKLVGPERGDWKALLEGVPSHLQARAKSASHQLETVQAALWDMGLKGFVDIDFTIVRGLAYYTGTVFELFDWNKTFRAICGGGRYDNLTAAIGGVSLPAVGFGMGDVVLGELLRDKDKLRSYRGSVDVFLVAERMEDALKLAHELRDDTEDIRTEYALGGQTASKQRDIAIARKASVIVTLSAGMARLEDLVSKVPPQSVPIPNAIAAIKQLLSAGR